MARLRVESPVGGVKGTTLYQAVDADGAPVVGTRVALVGLVHGNETVGGRVLDELEDLLRGGLASGEVLAVRANLRAAELGVRHSLDGTDLNRLWDPRRLARISARGASSYEESRAVELAPLLQGCGVILDLHSTSQPSPAFLIFRDDQDHAEVARQLGVELLVTGLFERAILDGGMCPDVGLAWGERARGRRGFTLEAGQHSDPANTRRAADVVVRLLDALGLWRGSRPPAGPSPRVYEVTDRFRQAPAGTPPWRFVGHQGGEPGGGRRGAARVLASFEEVQADEILLRRGATGVARAQAPFTILLPTPTALPGEDLYYTARRRRGGVAEGEATREDHEARREAQAVERVLDQLDADAFERGTSWASFDPRHVLDLCAALVSRALRLPPGHLHRRLSLVGRGGSGGTEGERRAGRRYRSAVRRAIADGVPLERVQLLRGASLGWIESFTGPAMVELLQQRRVALGDADDSLRLYLSAHQPHTVSLLVVGDLDRALEDGDTRHVRVVVLVEAATAEPDGASAAVRIVRGGLVSSRPEILRAARRLLRGLQEEHRLLVDRPPLCDLPTLHELMGPDGGLLLPVDEELRRELASGLRELLVQQWREPLAPVVRPALLANPQEVGRWLATTMGESGVLDPEALSALLLTEEVAGWRVDPSGLDRASSVQLPPAPERLVPDAPLLADEVDADGLQRWLSWKRWLHDGRVIPDTRGKDLDLALSEGDIRRRVAGWFRHAHRQAHHQGEDVLVVVAGDGLSAERDANGDAEELLAAHDRLLEDPAVRYLRIQHLPGAHLGWIKHLGLTMARRPAGEPAGVQWEDAHGASVNVVLVAVREHGETSDEGGPWSLEGWSIERCGVVLSDLHASPSRDYALAMFTEPNPGTGRVHQELVAFARAHCEGLLTQGGPRAIDPHTFRETVVARIARWVERARQWREALVPPPEASDAVDERAAWVASWVGISDPGVAVDLAEEMDGDAPAAEAAARIWAEVDAWPHQGPGAV